MEDDQQTPLPASERTGFGERVERAQPPERTVALFWLGQEGIALKGDGTTLLIDPFLSRFPPRIVPPADTPEAFHHVDYVIATHEHLDHLDLEAWKRLAASERARFVVPRALEEQVTGIGISTDRLELADVGEELRLGAARLLPVRGIHGVSMEAGYSDGTDVPPGLPRFLGYVIDLAGIRIYHAGDTIIFPELIEALTPLGIEIALLPINGRDFFREREGLVGNMNGREAAELAATIGAKVVVPMHWDAISGNTVSPGEFIEYLTQTHPEITALVMGRFGGVMLGKPA